MIASAEPHLTSPGAGSHSSSGSFDDFAHDANFDGPQLAGLNSRGEGSGVASSGSRSKAPTPERRKQSASEEAAVRWVQSVVPDVAADLSTPGALGDELRSGVVLCALLNAICPSTVPKIHYGGTAAKQRDNISSYLQGAAKIGVPASLAFRPDDVSRPGPRTVD